MSAYDALAPARCHDGPEQAAVIRSILKLFEKFDAAYGRLIQSINQVAPHRVKGGGMPALFVKKDRYMVVPVFYGTDRAVSAVRKVRTPPKEKYGERYWLFS